MKDTERSANLKWMKFLKTAKHQSAFRVCDVSECYSSVTCSKNCSVWNSSVSTYWHSETISFMHLWPVSLISALIHAGAKIIYIYIRYITSLLLQMSQAFQALSRIQTPSNATHQPDALLGRYRLRVTSSMSIMLHALIQRLCLSTKSGVKHAESQISYRYIINY